MPRKQPWIGFQLRATAEWLAWLRRLARHVETSTSATVCRGLAMLAASVGFEPPPPRSSTGTETK